LSCQSQEGGLGRVSQELGTAFLFGGFPDPLGRNREGVQRPQKSAVGFVLPRDRARPSPACPTERIEATVITGSGKRVRHDVCFPAVHLERVLRERRPTQAGRRMLANNLYELLSATPAEGRGSRIRR